MKKEINITVLLEHHKEDKMWTSHTPLIEGCLAEGSNREEATKAIVPEIQYFLKRNPEIIESLENPPEFQLSSVNIQIETT